MILFILLQIFIFYRILGQCWIYNYIKSKLLKQICYQIWNLPQWLLVIFETEKNATHLFYSIGHFKSSVTKVNFNSLEFPVRLVFCWKLRSDLVDIIHNFLLWIMTVMFILLKIRIITKFLLRYPPQRIDVPSFVT